MSFVLSARALRETHNNTRNSCSYNALFPKEFFYGYYLNILRFL